MLDRLMDGAPVPERPVLVPPAGVVLRRSTDAVAAADPLVRAALGFIAGAWRTEPKPLTPRGGVWYRRNQR